MLRLNRTLLAGAALIATGALFATQTTAAGVTLNGARVGAVDVPATAKFYETAFGMQEVQRIPMGKVAEVMLNFGDSVATAKANPNAQVVITPRDSNDLKDTVPHVIFNVTDIKATAAAVVAAGGKMTREPFEFGKTGIMIGMATDPAGNLIEMLQQPKK
ncbi:MAG TPA: VOC family protein [Steroidobacteraceae bacterium]|jgi:predicted enzyme related to lactoylglutathione lyase